MYRPSVQAVPGAKVLRRRPVAPTARHAVLSVQGVLNGLNARSAVSRPRSSPRPNAASARGGRHRRLLRSRWTAAASGPRAAPTTRRGG
ncbi:hypothetical protein ACFQ05_12295 [Amycolatopsis umgeniensis]|uniref:Uncharacterized protein n=1 Tax=Amycolatopsis umgeniensis TaxID=336628 RepID=A0A841B692_9PSEU|nr:hypothetical protein [Amycolatopsis umgeniensis]